MNSTKEQNNNTNNNQGPKIAGIEIFGIVAFIVAVVYLIGYGDTENNMLWFVVFSAIAVFAAIGLSVSISNKYHYSKVKLGRYGNNNNKPRFDIKMTDDFKVEEKKDPLSGVTQKTIVNYSTVVEQSETSRDIEGMKEYINSKEGFMIINKSSAKDIKEQPQQEMKQPTPQNIVPPKISEIKITDQITIVDKKEVEIAEQETPKTEQKTIWSENEESNATKQAPTIEIENAPTEPKSEDVFAEQEPKGCVVKDIPLELISIPHSTPADSNEELTQLIKLYLKAIHQAIPSNAVTLMWVSGEYIYTEAALIPESERPYIVNKFPIGEDYISNIIRSGTPKTFSGISSEQATAVLPYYSQPLGIDSFIGIPIMQGENVVGILCADSKEPNYFDDMSIAGFLGNFTALISMQLDSFDNRIQNETASRTLATLNKLSAYVAEYEECDRKSICDAVLKFIAAEVFDCDALGICLLGEEAIDVVSYNSKHALADNMLNSTADINSSLVAYCLKKEQPLFIPSVPKGYCGINQFVGSITGSSCIVYPIKSFNGLLGAVYMQDGGGSLTEYVNADLLNAICQQLGELLERIALNNNYSKLVSIDMRYDILTKTAFQTAINTELARAAATDSIVTLALIALDKYEYFNDPRKKSDVMKYIINSTKKNIQQFDIIGKVNEDVFGVLFVNNGAEDAKFIFEQMRRSISTTQMNVDGDTLMATISVGITPSSQKMDFSTFTRNATKSLQKAQEQKNSVYIFE